MQHMRKNIVKGLKKVITMIDDKPVKKRLRAKKDYCLSLTDDDIERAKRLSKYLHPTDTLSRSEVVSIALKKLHSDYFAGNNKKEKQAEFFN